MNKAQKKLHIVYLDFDDIKNPLLAGGQAISTKEIGSRLSKKGHEVVSLCSRYPRSKDRTENGIIYKHIGLGSRFIRLNNLFYILLVPFYVRSIKADIIIECFTAPISTLFSPLFTKIPVVAFPSVFAAHQFSRKYHLPFHLVESYGCKFYKYFLPYTDNIDHRMKKINPKIYSKVVPHGISDEYFKIKLQKPKYILFLGRLDIDQKGIDLLLKAYKKIVDEINIPLIIAGNGPDEKKITSLIKELKLEKTVQMVGPVFGDKKKKIMAQAHFVTFSSRHDDMSIWALEALACGLPIVMFDAPEFSWATNDFAYKAKSYDINDFAKQINIASKDKKINQKRKLAKKYAKNFNWDKVADQFENFFESVLKKERQKKHD